MQEKRDTNISQVYKHNQRAEDSTLSGSLGQETCELYSWNYIYASVT